MVQSVRANSTVQSIVVSKPHAAVLADAPSGSESVRRARCIVGGRRARQAIVVVRLRLTVRVTEGCVIQRKFRCRNCTRSFRVLLLFAQTLSITIEITALELSGSGSGPQLHRGALRPPPPAAPAEEPPPPPPGSHQSL